MFYHVALYRSSILYVWLSPVLLMSLVCTSMITSYFLSARKSRLYLLPSYWLLGFLLQPSQQHPFTQCTNIPPHPSTFHAVHGSHSGPPSLCSKCSHQSFSGSPKEGEVVSAANPCQGPNTRILSSEISRMKGSNMWYPLPCSLSIVTCVTAPEYQRRQMILSVPESSFDCRFVCQIWILVFKQLLNLPEDCWEDWASDHVMDPSSYKLQEECRHVPTASG